MTSGSSPNISTRPKTSNVSKLLNRIIFIIINNLIELIHHLIYLSYTMKKLLFLFTISLMPFILQAQQATLRIKVLNASNNKVRIQHPVDGTWFPEAVDEQKNGIDSIIKYTLTVNKTTWLRINGYPFIIEPGITNIVFDYGKKDVLRHTDRNMEGIILFSKRDNQFYQDKARTFYKNDTNTVALLKRIEQEKEAELKPFTDLLVAKKISLNFYEAVQNYLNVNAVIIEAAIPMIVFSETKKLNSELDAMWTNAYKKHPLTNIQDTFNPDFYYHADYYVFTYLQYYLAQKRGIKSDIKNENDYFKYKYQCFGTTFSGKMREYLMASFLQNEMMQNKFQPVLLELFNDFEKQYPRSHFTPYLQTHATQIEAFNKVKKTSLNQKQKIIADYGKIDSFEQLLRQFKDKTVFIDIWATWCGPCKEEFRYNKDLEQFLTSKDIDILFISTDKDEADEQWKTMIKYYNLEGWHIRTNKALLQDLKNKFWAGKNGYAIPRYVLVSRGKVVNANTFRPSDKEQLYNQLISELKIGL
ncbi:Thiol-disulfide isomerase or thioredoxin [Pedobacter sp. ok626]|nr:Thiol-disulfide isomerase or thioredoxin [Pedobacter sp. ok626]